MRYCIVFALVLILVTSLQQLPQCQTGFFYQTLPLIPQQSYIANLDKLFGGYNLEYSTVIDDQIAKYVKLSSKMNKQNEQSPDTPLTNLKSYHMQKKGNVWGQGFIALGEQGSLTQVHYGILNNNVTAPIINNCIDVENNTNTTCYDAVLFQLQNLIIVDCAEKRTSNNSRGQIYENIFYYFYINNGTARKTVRTEMYAPFPLIVSRQLNIYSDLQSKHTFLLRTYLANGMPHPSRDNTYTEVFMIQDPLNPWVLGLLDRSFLGVAKLRIMDVKIYLGKIYILDYLKGLHQVSISAVENLEYLGVYEARGFSKFALYSPNLDDRIQLALVNEHSVHQIDWSDLQQPRLINKYSLMADSRISQIFLNDRFVFVQSSSTEGKVTYNYTWILNRGDRTYTRAFKVLKHDSRNIFIDLNEEFTFLLVISNVSMINYAIDQATLVIKLDNNQQMLDVMNNFTIRAYSTDPSTSGVNVTCQLLVNFTLLDENNRTMWPIGNAPPSFFNANFPGKVNIELSEYVLGPNVTYRIRQTQKGQLKSRVYQQQQLIVTWAKPPPFENITFLQTQTIHGQQRDSLVIYMQDAANMTYISYCSPDHEEIEVKCSQSERRDVGGKVNNWDTTLINSRFTHSEHHLLAYTTLKYYNTVFLNDLDTRKQFLQLNYGIGFPGNISSLSISGNYLFVVRKYIKYIDIYLLDACLQGKDLCVPVGRIDHMDMYERGLKYFAPTAVHSSRFHPDVLFIKTSDSIIAVDLRKQSVPKLLTVIHPVPDASTNFTFQVNSNFLIVSIPPGQVLEYDLSRLSLKQITFTKHYPLYGHKLPHNYDFSISEYGNCVYLSSVNEGGDYNVLVYRSGYPAVGTLYNQIDLFAYQNLLIDTSGYIVDYVTVVSGRQLRIFRQYELPVAQIKNPGEDYNFYLQYFNTIDSGKLQMVNVKIINLPTYIRVNPYLQDIMNTKDILYSGQDKLSEIDDSDWYEGNVLYIRPSCRDCGSKVKINNHIQAEGRIYVAPGLTDYSYNKRGGTLQTLGGLITLKNNGSVAQVVIFPQVQDKVCQQVSMSSSEQYQISGCIGEKTIHLYVTSMIGNKPYAFEPYETKAVHLTKLQAVNQVIMLVDTQSNPYHKTETGGIFLFEVDSQWELDQALTELQYLDGEDLGMRQLGDIFINNAELTYQRQTKSYRLYLTEMTRGMFMVEFTHVAGRPDIVIKQIAFINLKEMLAQMQETLPYDATYQAVTLIGRQFDAQKGSTDILLVTTGRYHTLQIQISYNKASSIVQKQITRFYLRYSYYEITNHVAFANNLFLVRHVLPDQYNEGDQSKQLYTIYNTLGRFNGTVQRRGLIGAFPLTDSRAHSFDFNLTYDEADRHTEPRVGMIIVENNGDSLNRASLHRNLSMLTTELLDTQIIYIDLVNDFNLEKIRILLNGRAPFPEWKLITIILFSAIGFLLLIGGGVLGVKKLREAMKVTSEERETMISEEAQG